MSISFLLKNEELPDLIRWVKQMEFCRAELMTVDLTVSSVDGHPNQAVIEIWDGEVCVLRTKIEDLYQNPEAADLVAVCERLEDDDEISRRIRGLVRATEWTFDSRVAGQSKAKMDAVVFLYATVIFDHFNVILVEEDKMSALPPHLQEVWREHLFRRTISFKGCAYWRGNNPVDPVLA